MLARPSLFVGCASSLLITVAVALSALPAPAASVDKLHAKSAMHSRGHHLYAMYRGPLDAQPAMLPYGPEYGFLRYVPANAIRAPGYTFMPGVGILGESCDMPTSACSNEYRDVQ